MKRLLLSSFVALLLFSGCSGFLPSFGGGAIVSPNELSGHNGGSLSTVWYLGSDKKFHYFTHYVKISTDYRVRREDMSVPDEFPYRSRPSVYTGDMGFFGNDSTTEPASQPNS